MQAMTIIIRFKDGQEIACIAPYQPIPEEELENCYFSEPHDMPDIKLSDLAGMTFEPVMTH